MFIESGTMIKMAKHRGGAYPHVLVLLGFNQYEFMRGIFAHAREARWTLDTNYNRIGLTPEPGERYSGIIALVGKQAELDVLRRYPTTPCVDLSAAWLWDLSAKGADRVGRVTYDPAALGTLAAGHLLDQGYRHLAFVNVCNGWHERPGIRTMAEEAEKRGGDFREIPLYRRITARPPYSAVRHTPAMLRWLSQQLRELPKPCGVAIVDEWAPHLLSVCAQADIAVPADLALIGIFNQGEVCELAPIPISSVDIDFEHIAREGSRLLGRLMSGAKPAADPILLPPRGVVVRQSTNLLAVHHRQVAKAVHFIHEHFSAPLSIGQIANVAGLSRRGLTVAFRRELGESVARYIARYRAGEAGRLLCVTNLKTAEVADRAGYTSLQHLARAFKRTVGTTPALYRQQHRQQG
jgi:LacI family transcriptional regulator